MLSVTTNLPVSKLEAKAREIRRQIIKMIYRAGSGHPGGSLSSTDILAALFFGGGLRFNSQDLDDPRADRFILSAGHVCPAYYAVLSKCGLIKEKELANLRRLGSCLQGHPSSLHAPFIACSTGSLGQGLSVGLGMALASKLRKGNNFIFVLTYSYLVF